MAFNLGRFLIGDKGGMRQTPTLSPQQLTGQSQALGMGLSGLQDLQKQKFNFEPIAQQARTQFQTQTIPQLAERFTGMGGGQRSSAFQGALGQAGSGLEEALASLKEQYGLQERGQQQSLFQNLLGLGLQPQFQTYYQAPQSGLLQGFLGQGLSGGQQSGGMDIASLMKILSMLGGI